MAERNTVTLTFAGDAKQLDRTMDQVGKSAIDMSKDFAKADDSARQFSRSADDLGDASGNVESKLMGVNDLVGGFADTMGLALPPQFGMVMGFADMFGGMEKLVPMMGKMKNVQAALNATMRANPILTVVTILALLGTAFVVAYKKSETFRKIVDGALAGVRQAIVFLKDAFVSLWHTVDGVFNMIFDKIKWLWEHSPLGLLVNNLGKIADIGGKIGGAIGGLNPFANGGAVSGSSPIMVGERGPEIFVPNVPGHVVTNNQMRAGGGSSGSQTVTVEFVGTGDPIFEAFKKQIRIRGGYERALAR